MLKNFWISLILIALAARSFAQNPRWTTWETDADTLVAQEKYKKAIGLYSKIIKASHLKDKSDYRILYKRAVAYYSAGQWNAAIADISKFIAEFPQNFQAHILRALVYRELDDIDKQLADIDAAVELTGLDTRLLHWRASLLMEKEEFERAKEGFKLIAKLEDSAEIELNLALSYYSLQQTDSALMAVTRAIELDGTYEPAYYYGGAFAMDLERYDQALKFLEVAVRLDSENLQALFYKGIALVELKREEEGCRCLNQVFYKGIDEAADYLKQYCFDAFKD